MVGQGKFLEESALASALAAAKEVTDRAAELNRLGAQESRLNSEQASLSPWSALDVPMELASGENTITAVWTGTPTMWGPGADYPVTYTFICD